MGKCKKSNTQSRQIVREKLKSSDMGRYEDDGLALFECELFYFNNSLFLNCDELKSRENDN